MNKKLYADRLSDLVLNLGVALKKGEHLNIAVSPDAYYYAQRLRSLTRQIQGLLPGNGRPYIYSILYERVRKRRDPGRNKECKD